MCKIKTEPQLAGRQAGEEWGAGKNSDQVCYFVAFCITQSEMYVSFWIYS